MGTGPGDNQPAPAGANATGPLDLQLLESILQATLSEQRRQPLPPALDAILARRRGSEPDGALVSEMVSAALTDFWVNGFAPEQRRTICDAVAQQLLDDPVATQRIRGLLQAGK